MRTYVTFESDAFNTTEQKPTFINPDCFGDDVLAWLAQELKAMGVETDEPGAEDFGWYLPYKVDGETYFITGSLRPGDENLPDLWIFEIEKSVAFWKMLFGKQHEDISPNAVAVVHDCLKKNPQIRNILWHDKKAFEAANYEESLGSPEP